MAFFSYKLKTYALLDERGRVTLKGSGFRSRGLEPFQRRLIEEIVRLLLESRGKEVRAVIDRWLEDFARRRVPARLFARTETLGDTLEAYREKIAAGVRSPAAAYELVSQTPQPDSEVLQKANLGAGEMYDIQKKRDLATRKYQAVLATNSDTAPAER